MVLGSLHRHYEAQPLLGINRRSIELHEDRWSFAIIHVDTSIVELDDYSQLLTLMLQLRHSQWLFCLAFVLLRRNCLMGGHLVVDISVEMLAEHAVCVVPHTYCSVEDRILVGHVLLEVKLDGAQVHFSKEVCVEGHVLVALVIICLLLVNGNFHLSD